MMGNRTVAMAVACAALLWGCGPEESASPPTPRLLAVAEPVLDVTTDFVRRGAILPRVSVAGSLKARRESRIGSRVYGRIERVFVREGDRVVKGDRLFQVERGSYQVALRQAEAGLDLARAERMQVGVDLERAKKLHQEDFVSKQQLDRLSTQYAVAEARERQAAQAVELAQQDLRNTLVRAPFAGSVSQRLEDEGTTATTQPQTIVIVLQETGLLEVHTAIAETNLALIQLGDPAWLHIEGFIDPIETTVSTVGDTVDPATRTYMVRMLVPNPDHLYKAGVFVHAEIEPRSKGNVILVPRDAIKTEDGRTLVFTVREGRATPVPVRLGVVTEEAAEVLEGLEPGDEVITGDGLDLVAPGTRVRAAGRPGSPA